MGRRMKGSPLGLLVFICLADVCTSFLSRIREARGCGLSSALGMKRSSTLRHGPALPAVKLVGEDSLIGENDIDVVRSYTEAAIRQKGQLEGMQAIEALSRLCTQRSSYSFDEPRYQGAGSLLSHAPGVLPQETTKAVNDRVFEMEQHGWLSTNPDSVDGLPSFHLNLISNGEPLVSSDAEDMEDFDVCLRELTDLVTPFVYHELLPKVNTLMNSTSIRVSDVFLRRYGQDLIDGKSRTGISAHYDVFSPVTSVIALDDTAATGQNGLYTTAVTAAKADCPGKTSNHASLRRFFPLSCGDAVVHTWDVLHGVDVEPGLDRTSMIVWFSTIEDSEPKACASPWLMKGDNLADNHVAQFVLASAVESASSAIDGVETPRRLSDSNFSVTEEKCLDPYQLYLESATRENTFALTRVGSLCEEGVLSDNQIAKATALLDSMRPVKDLPIPLQAQHLSPMFLAQRFWLEGAVRGSPLSQSALADEIMVTAFESSDSNAGSEARLLATVLFALAAQQGHNPARESLMRVCQLEASLLGDEYNLEESPLFQTVAAALG